MLELVFLILLLYMLVVPIVLLARQREIRTRLEATEQKIALVLQDLGRLHGSNRRVPGTETEIASGVSELEEADAQETTKAVQQELDTEATSASGSGTEAEPASDMPGMAAASDIPSVARASVQPQDTEPRQRRSVEETLASTWMIWFGAVAVALSVVFLFRYAVDQGWLTPLTRVVLGLVLGGCLISAGEWAKRHPVEAVRRAVNPDFVPPALTGSGVFAVFVSLYAAHALFGLLSPAISFVLLGLTSLSALVLSIRQGLFVALLGLLAGYLVPALIDTPEPQAAPLFLYLFVLTDETPMAQPLFM